MEKTIYQKQLNFILNLDKKIIPNNHYFFKPNYKTLTNWHIETTTITRPSFKYTPPQIIRNGDLMVNIYMRLKFNKNT